MDAQPKFQRQALNWIASLNACAAHEDFAIFVHYVGPHPSALLRKLETAGAKLVETEPYGSGPAVYCNKLMQLDTFRDSDFDEIALTDADIAFLRSPASLVGSGVVRAKIVDLDNPKEDVLRELLGRTAYGGEPLEAHPDFAPYTSTHRYNCNGGFYVLPQVVLRQLAAAWRQWAAFCLEQTDLLGRSAIHSDQLGFMLAMVARRPPFEPLPIEFNFPTHLDATAYEGLRLLEINALHYHSGMADSGMILPTGHRFIDLRIAEANANISAARTRLSL